jgi:hypothetical protein
MKLNTNGIPGIQNFITLYQTYVDWYKYFKKKDIEYLFEEDPSGIPVYGARDIEAINREPSKCIFVDNSTEGIRSIIDFEQYDTTKYYIFLSNGDWNPDYYKLPFKYINLVRHLFQFEYIDYVFNPHRLLYHTDFKYDFDCPKPYEFISTIGMCRDERDKFIEKFLNQYRGRDYILKYQGQDLGKDSTTIDDAHTDSENFNSTSVVPQLEKYYYSVCFSLPIDMYNQGKYNLLVEGEIDWPEQFTPTEKVVKVLLSGMPFVLVGSPYFLKNIQNFGFRTYQDLWDESYDDIVDYDERIDKITELCNTLMDFDWNANKEKLQEIAMHNRLRFLEGQDFFKKEFLLNKKRLEKFKSDC